MPRKQVKHSVGSKKNCKGYSNTCVLVAWKLPELINIIEKKEGFTGDITSDVNLFKIGL